MYISPGGALKGRERQLADEIVGIHYREFPELTRLYGPEGYEKCVDDVRFHLIYLDAAISLSSIEIFLGYIAWAKTLFQELKIDLVHLSATLDAMAQVLSHRLPPEVANEAVRYIQTVRGTLDAIETKTKPEIDQNKPFFSHANQFLDLLMHRKRKDASDLILKIADSGVKVSDIYIHILQPALRDVGHLWQTGKVTVAQEHYFTAATQMIMSQLYPHLFAEKSAGRLMVASCVPGELHEIGMRMLSDIFESEGWDTHYIGANVPESGIIDTVMDLDADILCISATIPAHLPKIAGLLRSLRSHDRTRDVPVMVGGYPFNNDPSLWRKLGADGFAPDAVAALGVAESLVNRTKGKFDQS